MKIPGQFSTKINTVSIDRARHALQFLQEVVENDASAAQATAEDMIAVLEELVG